MFEPVLVIAHREIPARMSAAGFCACDSTRNHHLGQVQEVCDLESMIKIRVVDGVFVLNANVVVTFPQRLYLLQSLTQLLTSPELVGPNK